jgi:hypothetical protein
VKKKFLYSLCLVSLLLITVFVPVKANHQQEDQILVSKPVDTTLGGNIITDTMFFLFGACTVDEWLAKPTDYCPDSNVLEYILMSQIQGETIMMTSANDPVFDTVTSRLTDGLDEIAEVRWSFGSGGGSQSLDESTFFGDQAGPNGIDLAGYAISSIGLVVEEFEASSPGSDPNGDGIWTDAQLSGRLIILGHLLGKNDCKNDGWQSMTREDGTTFNNQGDCIQYFNTGK